MGPTDGNGRIQRHILVEGEVQGVGFRRFTEACGERHGIRGYVRNLRDGRVEILAWNSTLSFEDEVRRGPPHSRVDKFETHDRAGSTELPEPKKFTVLTDGESAWFRY